MGGRYPPGVSAGSPRAPWNAPDMDHEHEFELHPEAPLFEDGAAIFREECVWEKELKVVEGYEGSKVVEESIPCEESRLYRFELISVSWGEGLSVENVEGFPLSDDEIHPRVESALSLIGGKFASDDSVEVVEIDLDRKTGHVEVLHKGYTLRYEPVGDDG